MIINQGFESKQYNVPGLGLVTLNNFQVINEDTVLGKAILKHFPSICGKSLSVDVPDNIEVETIKEYFEKEIKKDESIEPELLVEEPIEQATVEVEQEVKTVEQVEETKPKRGRKSNK